MGEKQDDVAAIVAGLSKPVRQALLRAELEGNLGRYFARFISIAAGRGLIKAGLGTAVWSGVMLNSQGERVRSALIARGVGE